MAQGIRTRVAGAVGSALIAAAGTAGAGPADVVAAEADCDGARCSFRVTVRHADEGWDHYANAWQVVAPDGRVLATRILRHPHVDEQPFTRELRGAELPAEMERVTIRARDSVHGLGGREVEVVLERQEPDAEEER